MNLQAEIRAVLDDLGELAREVTHADDDDAAQEALVRGHRVISEPPRGQDEDDEGHGREGDPPQELDVQEIEQHPQDDGSDRDRFEDPRVDGARRPRRLHVVHAAVVERALHDERVERRLEEQVRVNQPLVKPESQAMREDDEDGDEHALEAEEDETTGRS